MITSASNPRLKLVRKLASGRQRAKLGLFACQHHAPDYFAQAPYQQHRNGALALRNVWITGAGALDLVDYMRAVTGADRIVAERDRTAIPAGDQTIVLSDAPAFETAFGVPPPHPEDGPALSGFTLSCRGTARRIIEPKDAFGVAILLKG